MKVDIQIKVVKDGVDYIFTGVGTAQRDDDINIPYGGLVYIYNDVEIIIYPPADGVFSAITPGIAYTGTVLFSNSS